MGLVTRGRTLLFDVTSRLERKIRKDGVYLRRIIRCFDTTFNLVYCRHFFADFAKMKTIVRAVHDTQL